MKMVRVRLLVSRAGEDGAQNRGDEILVPENEVKPMTEAGQCELVDEAAPKRGAPKERAVKAPKVEKAVG